MDVQDLAQLVDASRFEAFRLETHPQYLVPQEAEEFTAWRAGRPVVLQTPETSDWLAKIRRTTAAGYRWSRVHVVDWPLADYTRYELWGYQANVAAGEEVRIADRRAAPVLDQMRRDFWLIDDEIAVWMDYDLEGRFLGAELADPVGAELARRTRAAAWAHAVPLDVYMVQARPRLTA